MTFTDPAYLLLLIPAIAWAIGLSRAMRGMARERRVFAIIVRSLFIVLLVLALSGLQSVRTNKGVATLFVLDKSASIDDSSAQNAQRFIARALNTLGQDDSSGLVAFGKNPVIDTDAGALRRLGPIYASPDPSSTNIAAAIRLASAALPQGAARRLVLLTDGNETDGDAAQAAEAAAAENIQIDAYPLGRPAGERGEVVLRSVNGPEDVAQGEPFELKVVALATKPTEGILQIDRNGTPVASRSVNLIAGTNVLTTGLTAPGPGFYSYRAGLEIAPGGDTDPRNNVGIGFVNVRGRPRVLLLEGVKGSAQALETALKPHDLDIVRAGIEALPTRPQDLQAYDSLILSDYPAGGLTDSQMAMIASAVRDSGLGFGMIGGDNSFLPGGYYATPIADILPVDLNVRQRRVFPSTCIEIVIDASGSMAMTEDGTEKIKIAATAAAQIVRMMSPNDLVGIAGSTDDIAFVAPIQPCRNKDMIADQAGRLDAGGGGIYIEPSLEFADRTLTPVNTKVKHLILMSDGDDAETQEGSFELAQRMVAKGMTISVVAIGDGKDVGFLRALAATGKGYFYLAKQAHSIQRFITQDASVMSRSAIEEGAFIPKVDPGDEVLRGINLQTMPALLAYDLTSDRPLARTPMRTTKDDPLLAYWQYGLGTTMAFTSDAQPKWARRWMEWPDFNAFWAQAIRATMRQTSAQNIQMSVSSSGGHADLDVSAFDPFGAPINGMQAQVSVIGPDNRPQALTLSQSGPGHYQAQFDASQTGAYLITAAQPAATADGKPSITRTGFSVAYPPEFQATGPNISLLEQIAKTTGGKILDHPAAAFRPADRPGESVSDLWPTLLLAAAILFVLDIAVRRLAIPLPEIPLLGRRMPARQSRGGDGAKRAIPSSPKESAAEPRTARGNGVAPVDIEDERPPADSRRRKPDSRALSTANRLLDVKRKGRRPDGD